MGTEQSAQQIITCLWFDDQAEEAAGFYTSIFPNSRLTNTSRYGEAGREIHGKPPGSVMTVEFELNGQAFTGLNGGPHFLFTPAISLFVSCKTEEEVDTVWGRLSPGGSALMPLDKYPFSERYGWLQDKYGLSWQIGVFGEGDAKQTVTPTLMFVGEQGGKAEDAMRFYASVFDDSGIGDIFRYERGEEPDEEGTVKYADFTLEGQRFAAMDSNHEHHFTFNEAISFQVMCENQEEVDYYWEKLSAGGDEKAQQCGWLKDSYGVSWQIIPRDWIEIAADSESEKSQRAFAAMMKMKKLDLAELKRAYEG